VPYSALEKAPETSILIQNLSNSKAVAVLWFAATLVEEVGRTDSQSMKQLSLSLTLYLFYEENVLIEFPDTSFISE